MVVSRAQMCPSKHLHSEYDLADSISRQHWHAIYYTFRHLNITFDSNPKHLPLAGTPNVEQFVLKKDSAMTKILQEKAGVPQSRMERPFFTLLEDHMGLGEPDIRTITHAKPDYHWFHKFRRVEGWEDHLKWLAMSREGEEDSVTEDTLVMINAGAHVCPSCSGFLLETNLNTLVVAA